MTSDDKPPLYWFDGAAVACHGVRLINKASCSGHCASFLLAPAPAAAAAAINDASMSKALYLATKKIVHQRIFGNRPRRRTHSTIRKTSVANRPPYCVNAMR